MLKELFRQIYDSHIWDDITVDRFKEKFGEDLYKQFTESRDRLKNAGMSLNVNDYVKDPEWTPETLQAKFDELERNVKMHRRTLNQDKKGQIVGKYNYYGIHDGYAVYEPLDVEASVSMGVNTGWCTTGRWDHAGQPDFKPSYERAAEHFNDYRKHGRLIYFLNPSNNYGEWAVMVYNGPIKVNESITIDGEQAYIETTNLEIFNAEDDRSYYNKQLINILTQLKITPNLVINKVHEENNLKIANSVLVGCVQEQIANDITIPGGVTTIGKYAFQGCTGLTSITIPGSVTSIGQSAFYGCTGLTEVTIPNSVTNIAGGAFFGCTGLTKITIPTSVARIGPQVFYGCTSLSSITIPNSVTSIGDYAFYGCEQLTNITIPDSVTSIEWAEFKNCGMLRSITIPDSVTRIDSSAFANCVNLKSITIPDGVISIGSYTFEHCQGLSSITIPNRLESMGCTAFYGCINLKSIHYKGTKENFQKLVITADLADNSAIKVIHCTDGDIEI